MLTALLQSARTDTMEEKVAQCMPCLALMALCSITGGYRVFYITVLHPFMNWFTDDLLEQLLKQARTGLEMD